MFTEKRALEVGDPGQRAPERRLAWSPAADVSSFAVGSVVSSMQCAVLEQQSRARCVRGVSFDCDADGASLWVRRCRGVFRCGAHTVNCGDWVNSASACLCERTPPQLSFTAYLISLNFTAKRALISKKELSRAGLPVVAVPGVYGKASETSYSAMTRAHLRAWELILANGSSSTRDEYSLVFEDDVMRDRRVTAEEVLPALSHTAKLSHLKRLPFFYVDACAFQHQLTRNAFVIEFGPKLPIGGAGRSLHFLRVAGSCASAYAVRRRSIPFLQELATRCESSCVALDQILVRLSIALGGAFVAGVGVTPPGRDTTHPHVVHRSGPQGTGLFKQDRRRAGSVTADKSWRNFSHDGFDPRRLDCSRCVHNAVLGLRASNESHSEQTAHAFSASPRAPASAFEEDPSKKNTIRCMAWAMYNGQGQFIHKGWKEMSRSECPRIVQLKD